ncbi:serpin family protein [Streptomyces sp. 4N509B]|uniref:serpin family protein n=1 Tax=Streptomyces sp. 4N509B TaxID=3457413 RepID=UPI003FD243D5
MVAGTALVGHGGAVRGLAERWLAMAARPEEDLACSPAGLWLALGAVAAGAREATARELRELLGVAGEEAAPAVTEVARELGRTEALGVATGVWARVPVCRALREALPEIGFGGAPDQAAIDAWVDEATDGLIPRLPVTVTPETLLVLVNALLLKARWERPFPGWLTGELPFTDAFGARHGVATMRQTLPVADAWRVGRGRDEVSVVQLRCAAGGAGGLPAVARFVLGAEGLAPARVLAAAWAEPARRSAFEADQVSVALPRLSLRSRLSLLPQLARLGVRTLGTPAADLSGLSPERLMVSQVVQECVLKVAEEGVEAAAVTAVTARAGSALLRPPRVHQVRFDRPFGVVLLDGEGAVPLFTAWQASAPVGP